MGRHTGLPLQGKFFRAGWIPPLHSRICSRSGKIIYRDARPSVLFTENPPAADQFALGTLFSTFSDIYTSLENSLVMPFKIPLYFIRNLRYHFLKWKDKGRKLWKTRSHGKLIWKAPLPGPGRKASIFFWISLTLDELAASRWMRLRIQTQR